MSAAGTPQKERASAGSPPAVERPRRGDRSPWATWAAVVALVVAAVAGFAVGRNTGPSESRTVTEQVLIREPTAMPAYATWKRSATVFFDGGVCSYVGPAEMPVGTKGEFNYHGPEGSVLVIQPMPDTSDAYTYEDAVDMLYVFGAGTGAAMTRPADAAKALLHPDLTEGVWMVGCKEHPHAGTTFTATAIRVTP